LLEAFVNKKAVSNEKEISASSAGEVSLGGELSVHRLGFGAMRITGEGIWGPPRDSAGARAVLRRAVELGVNFIDTADSYGPRVSEELIANALAPYPEDLVIATKGGWNRPGPDQWAHDASPKHLREAVEGSLKRLKLDRIDVYQLHAPDRLYLLTLRLKLWPNCATRGRFVWWPYRTLPGSISSVRAKSSRLPLSRTDTVSPIANGTTWWTIVKRTGLHLSRGFISERGRSPATCSMKSPKRATPKQVALAWLLQRSPMMLPIPGTSSIEHLEENVAAASIRLTEEEYERLASVPEMDWAA
jgi:pyridoxine 4-dehydrogenase